MKRQTTTRSYSVIYYRLIALWVLCEAMLGGIIHGLRLPVSGLIVGSGAVICISLIAWYVPAKGAILKATITVAIFKMMLSPQAPPPAYIAVFFQGLLGEILFQKKKFFKISCILLALLALLESGMQRILVLTLVYGNDFWKVINDFINGFTKQKIAANYSLWIGGIYLLLHGMTGIIVGSWAAILPQRISKWSVDVENKFKIISKNAFIKPATIKKKKRLKIGLFIIWILLVLLYIQSRFHIGVPILPGRVALIILIRSVIIVLSWYFLARPLLNYLLHRWLQKKKKGLQNDLQAVMQLLPVTRELVLQSWELAGVKTGWKKIKLFGKIVLANALSPGILQQVFILTGPVQTGKTSLLLQWWMEHRDAKGILTPVVRGKRVFLDLQSGEQFQMEAAEGETEILEIGKFKFSKTAFERAENIIYNAIGDEGWLIIDEIGPLELREEGFYKALQQVLKTGNKNQKIILVVREPALESVKEKFNLNFITVINETDELR